MATLNDMDEFVNWDKAGDAVGEPFPDPTHADLIAGPSIDSIGLDLGLDLALENANEDDFSFHALQHFTENAFPLPDAAAELMQMDTMAPMDFWDTPSTPCTACALGGFSCKTIREGQYKGFCTSCVALQAQCSFATAPAPASLAAPELTAVSVNPWPTAANATLSEDLLEGSIRSSRNTSVTDLASLGKGTGDAFPAKAAPPPKIGARFSRESVRILKNWLSTHNRHPYPSDDEKEMLQRQTGLNKTQITNWLANARRRGKVQAPPRSTSPHYGSWSGAIEIPKRRGTPALEAMNPLQRWEHSPPENEPASATAIARAVTASSSSSAMSSGLDSPHSFNYTDDGSGRSVCNQSSASSLGTSQSSNGSLNSAYSHGSRNSWASLGSAPFNSRSRRRRRRRTTTGNKSGDGKTDLSVPLKTFQCTFCTETFRTKHDWQRHEKTLHLSLERWVCSPHGPRAVNPETGQLSCAFCGLANPDDGHIEGHNHSACQERSASERSFYRKDHLNQHLRLVHNVKFMDWSMKSWKVATPEIRSRCGFCGIVMDTWTSRVDHLAEHFKTGYSMADWQGDWGFEGRVLDMVENSIPPYLIHYERTSPFPYVANQSPPESPRNAYELIKLELAYFMNNYEDQHGRLPDDEELMVEGCRIIFASELLSLRGVATLPSWLRDIIMNSDKLMQKAKFGPLRGAAENRLQTLKINGKDNLFEECPMEVQLQEFVRAKKMLGLTAMDDELQEEACRIVGRVEEVSTHPSEVIANWLLRLVVSSTGWLAHFRRRAHLPRSEDVKDQICRSTDPKLIDSTIHSYSRLERELNEFLKAQRAMGLEPCDDDLQRQARIIIYEFDDGWNQTAADNVSWLASFRKRHTPNAIVPQTSPGRLSTVPSTESPTSGAMRTTPTTVSPSGPTMPEAYNPSGGAINAQLGKFFLNDANCYRRLAKELARYVTSAMSANNPNQHVPSDAELQHQARFILYDDDDPWNQTAADNAEWLQRLKRSVGIIKSPGPGLPLHSSWALEQGGTGFAPPYACPATFAEPFQEGVQVAMDEGARSFPTGHSGANSYVGNLMSQATRPAVVFCSRELERGLTDYVEEHVRQSGRMPSDAALQARGRDILGTGHTAAEDDELLGMFKDMVAKRVPDALPASPDEPSVLPDNNSNMELHMSDEEMNSILQDMNFEFDTQDFNNTMASEGLNLAGSSLRD